MTLEAQVRESGEVCGGLGAGSEDGGRAKKLEKAGQRAPLPEAPEESSPASILSLGPFKTQIRPILDF